MRISPIVLLLVAVLGCGSETQPEKPAIEAAIRKAAGKPTGELTKADLEKVTTLVHPSNSEIADLTPLAELKGLKELALTDNNITDLTPLAGLAKLYWLELSNNQIADLTPLTGLKELKDLHLSNNQITDLKPLTGLTKLKRLSLSDNPNLTKAEIGKLQKALPNCKITHNATK